MKRYNVIVVYDNSEEKLLMCQRAKEPYKGMLNFVGGKVEPGEAEDDSAYRELFEETGISRDDILLTRVMDFKYYMADMELQVYSGKLTEEIALVEEVNKLLWVDRTENFCDMERFAGNCNIEHILQMVEYDRKKSLKTGTVRDET